MLALLQVFPDPGKLVLPPVEVVTDDGLPDDVAYSRFRSVYTGAG